MNPRKEAEGRVLGELGSWGEWDHLLWGVGIWGNFWNCLDREEIESKRSVSLGARTGRMGWAGIRKMNFRQRSEPKLRLRGLKCLKRGGGAVAWLRSIGAARQVLHPITRWSTEAHGPGCSWNGWALMTLHISGVSSGFISGPHFSGNLLSTVSWSKFLPLALSY